MTPTRSTRLVGLAASAALLPLLLGGLVACSSDSSEPDAGKTKKAAASGYDWDLALVSCLRDAGHDVADPERNGPAVGITITPGMDPAAYQKDFSACQTKVKSRLGARPVSDAEKKQTSESEKKIQEGNECLRKKGYDTGGDPGESGTPQIGPADIPDEVIAECGLMGGPASSGN
ncbi:hypothetical protein [Frondihabitans cladoniiphilus]|uniref:Secreted protein n=1 Tax=Frondihabitans cladoniiphilus TaxID=715785 RepID=A0ABP8VVW0_9MICO